MAANRDIRRVEKQGLSALLEWAFDKDTSDSDVDSEESTPPNPAASESTVDSTGEDS